MSRTDATGFTLLELLVSMVAVATMMVGIIQFFTLQHRTHAQQDESVAMEENLRLASGTRCEWPATGSRWTIRRPGSRGSPA
jgi:prepilin-type N-terminal cleavage/methylation domain-containing protein